MIGSFKTSNPFNIILLLIYAFVLRINSFLHPFTPRAQGTDGFLYHGVLNFLAPAGKVFPFLYPLLTLLLVFTQAISFNSLINNQKLFSKPNYLPALAYVLISSLFPEWWQLSSTLIINTVLLWVWAKLSTLFNHNSPKSVVFNVGFVVGLASFVYFPAIGFSILIFIGLITLRPFQISEWLVALLGITTPYYFLFAWLYLSGNWNPMAYLPKITVGYPAFQQSVWAWIALLLLMIPFMISGLYIQHNILRMLIQVRKSWNLMLLYLLTALLVPFINSTSTFEYWVLCALPFAAFHAYTYFYSDSSWLPQVLHWVTVVFIIALNFTLA